MLLTKRLADVESAFEKLKTVSAAAVGDAGLKKELDDLRKSVVAERMAFDSTVSHIKKALSTKGAEVASSVEHSVLKSAEELQALQSLLETKEARLKQAETQAEEAKKQADGLNKSLSRVKSDHASEREHWEAESKKAREAKASSESELLEVHRREIADIKERLEKAQAAEKEAQAQREELQVDVDALRRKTKLLEATQADRFQSEKDKIVQILEAGFAEREKLAVEKCREEMKSSCDEQVSKAVAELQSDQKRELEDSRAKFETCLSKRDEDFEKRLEASLSEAREEAKAEEAKALEVQKAAMEEERARALKAQADRMERRTRQEVEAMRLKFKMMTNAAIDSRSPSASESELSMV